MNTPNNKRRRESRRRMEKAFVVLLQNRELEEVSVTDICKEAQVNRTTFYANYQDIYALAEAVQQSLVQEVLALWQDEDMRNYDKGFPALFRHIRENQIFYKTYFKLDREGTLPFGYSEQTAGKFYKDQRYIEYHIAFFRSGFNAVIRKWLANGCKEEPEEIAAIIVEEYEPKGVGAKVLTP